MGVVLNKVRFRPPPGVDMAPLRDVTLAVRTGELVAVLGNSASGASTLAQLLTSPIPEGSIATGRIRIDGVNPHAGKVAIDKLAAYVGPHPTLGKRTLGRQLEDALLHAGFDRTEVEHRAGALLRAVGLGSAHGTHPHNLGVLDSHRADLALALATGAKVLVAERFGENSDTYIRTELRNLLREAHTYLNLTILFVTQDLGAVADLTERVVLMDEGVVTADSPVRAFFSSPPTPLARSLIAAAPRLTIADRASGRAAVIRALRKVRAAEAQDAQEVLQRRARRRDEDEENALREASVPGVDLSDTPDDAVEYDFASADKREHIIDLDHIVDGAHAHSPALIHSGTADDVVQEGDAACGSGVAGDPYAAGGEHGVGLAGYRAADSRWGEWDDDSIPLDSDDDYFNEDAFFDDATNVPEAENNSFASDSAFPADHAMVRRDGEAAIVGGVGAAPAAGRAAPQDEGVDLADTPQPGEDRPPRFTSEDLAPPRPTRVLEVDDLRVTRKEHWFRSGTHVLAGVDLTLMRGETLGVLGPSRCGSSALVRAIHGLEEVRRGTVTVAGTTALLGPDPGFADRPGKTVRDELHRALRPTVTEFDPNYLDMRARSLLHEAQLDTDMLGATLDSLDPLTRHTLALATALAARPQILLLDEPTLLLDAISARKYQQIVRRVQEGRNLSVVVTSHDPAKLVGVADRVVVLDRGRIVETGLAKDVLSSPAEAVTERLVLSVPIPNPLLQQRRRELRNSVLSLHSP